MFDKMKQIMEMKKQADQIKRDLDSMQTTCEDVEGIKIVINGSQNVQSFEIDENFLNTNDRAKFEADLLQSINAAIKHSQDLAAQKMKDAMGGFPGL